MSRPPALPCSRSRRERAQETSRNKERNSQWRRAAAGPPHQWQNNKTTSKRRPCPIGDGDGQTPATSFVSVSWICTRTSPHLLDVTAARGSSSYTARCRLPLYMPHVWPLARHACVIDRGAGRQAGKRSTSSSPP